MALRRHKTANRAKMAAGTVIGPGSELDGDLAIQHTVRVDGVLKGHLTTSDALVVSEKGVVEADTLEVGEAYISGRVSGHLMASRRVYLSAKSQFSGIVHTPHLVIEEGAVLRPPLAADPSSGRGKGG